MTKPKRVAITGLGIFSPLGAGMLDYWKSLLKGCFPLKRIDLFPVKEFKSKFAFQIGYFDFNSYFKYLKSEYLSRSSKFLLIAVKTALADAGLNKAFVYSKKDAGVFTSTIYGSCKASCDFYRDILLSGPDSVSPMAFPPTLTNYPSNYLSIVNDFGGPNLTFSSGFHAGLEAVNFAANLIKHGEIKVAVASGLNDLSIENYAQLDLKGFLHCPGNNPGEETGIFRDKRNGFILGENASTLILEDMENALSRKAKIYAEVIGYSVNFGKKDFSCVKTIEGALENCGLAARNIDLCLLSACGRRGEDLKELRAIAGVFKTALNKLDLFAVKENNGECEGASAVLQLLVAAKALHNKTIPASLFFEKRNGTVKIIRQKIKKKKISHVLINAFNPEGSNAAMVIRGA